MFTYNALILKMIINKLESKFVNNVTISIKVVILTPKIVFI